MQNLRCQTHPTEPITNFCTREQCLVELCATCICHHTEMHAHRGTLAHYENIQHTIKKAYDAVDGHMTAIEAEKRIIVGFNQEWEKKKANVYEVIKQAKKQVLETVDKTFAELQIHYAQKVRQQETKLGMKEADKVMKMLEAYTKQSEKLSSLQKDLAGPHAAATVKLLYAEALPRNTQIIKSITCDLSSLQKSDIKLDYLQLGLAAIKNNIYSLLALRVTSSEHLTARLPLVQIQESVAPLRAHSLDKTSSTVFSRPASVGKPIKGQVILANDASRIIIEQKPKISVISGKLSQSMNSSAGLSRHSKRPAIFGNQSALSLLR